MCFLKGVSMSIWVQKIFKTLTQLGPRYVISVGECEGISFNIINLNDILIIF